MLGEALEQSGCLLHAYVLMPNHVHLLACPSRGGSAAELMKRVGQRYVQHVNWKYKRAGTLWQGRYHASLVESERYLLTCQRYIELNPVRAGMVQHPGEFPWSSYRANAHGEPSAIITPHLVYTGMHPDKLEREACYRALFSEPIHTAQLEQLRHALNSNGICGSADFADTMGACLGRDFSMGKRRHKAF
jgi:putative transposase